MSICSSTLQHGGYTNSSLLEGDVKVRKCHAMLFVRTCMSRKLDVILTIRFKITAEIETTKHMFCVLRCRRGRVSGVLKSIIMFFHLFIAVEYAFTLFFTVNSSVNAAGDHLPAEVSWKRD